MLRWRLISAAMILGPILLLVWLDGNVNFGRPGIWLLPLGFLLVAAASGELHQLRVPEPTRPRDSLSTILLAVFTLAVAVLPILFPVLASGRISVWCWAVAAIMALVMVRMVIAMRDFRVTSNLTDAVAVDVFHIVYVVLPILFLLHLRLAWPDARGLWAMASIPWIAKMSDSGAYFAGRRLGRLAMAPQLSPKKTWEGAFGGAIVAVVASVAFFLIARVANRQPFAEDVSWWEMVGFGLVIAAAGMLGDLAESLLKRDAGRKDSSAWLPGLGGTLDVLDSILWAGPVGYFCWLLWLDKTS